MINASQIERVTVDDDLAERLRCIVDELGARGLPLSCIVRALLLEAAERFEADAALCAQSFAGCRATRSNVS